MRVVRSAQVGQPPDVVFRWIEDPSLVRQWQPGIADYRIVRDVPGRVGTRFLSYLYGSSGLVEMKGTIVGYEPGRSLALAMAGPDGSVGTLYRVEEVPGGTEVTVVVEQRIPGLLAQLLAPVLRRQVARQVEWELELLCQECCADPDDTGDVDAAGAPEPGR